MRKRVLRKRMAAIILAGCMVMGGLTGCGNSADSGETETASSETPESTVQEPSAEETKEEGEEPAEVSYKVVEGEPVDLSYYGGLLGASSTLTSLNDMEIMQVANDAVNVNVNYVHPATGTENETFNLRIASMELEDIMEYSWSSYPGSPTQAIEDGIIIDLAPYLEQGYAPNYKKILDENPDIAKQVTTDEGQIYAFACIGDESVNVSSGYIVREDMLNAVGLDVPETVADWEGMLTAFKDELGEDAPLTGTMDQIIGANAWFAGAFGTYSGFYVRDGAVHYGILEDGYRDYIDTMARWYAAGLIDPEIFGNDGTAVGSNLLNDRSGALFGFIGSGIGTYTNNAQANEGTNPDFKLIGVQYPVVNAGDEPEFINRSWDVRTQNMAAITTACEDIEAAMAYLDYWYSDEGHMLKNFGIEGLSYEMVDGEPQYTDLILNNPDGLSVAQALGRYTRASQPSVGVIDIRYYEGYYQLQEQRDAMTTWNEYADNALNVLMPTISATTEESEELATLTSSINTYVEEELTKFVMGTRDMSEYDSFVDTLKTMGIERVIEIKQAGYDRYMAR